MNWIYLSPHLDDVALSCGGLVWEQVQSGDTVGIWTVCAGAPPTEELSPYAQELHTRWATGRYATEQRRQEDIASCHRLGADYRHFAIPDCIYRKDSLSNRFLYDSEAGLSGTLHPGDTPVITSLQDELSQSLPKEFGLVCPLALGNHVDHQLTRQAVEGLGRDCWFYADYPYVLRIRPQVEDLAREGWISRVFPISQEGLTAWQDSVRAHHSQISSFWTTETEMRQAITAYLQQSDGVRLWRRPAE